MDKILRKRRWLGHVMRMSTNIPAKTALTWTPEGKRKKGRPRKLGRSMMVEGKLNL